MIEIYANGSRTEFMVSSTCTEASDFLLDLAALAAGCTRRVGKLPLQWVTAGLSPTR